MPNIAAIFKEEIARVARKEVRVETESLKKAANHHRSSIAFLKREIQTLNRELAKLRRTAGNPATAADNGDQVRHRFSAQRLVAHRNKLALSAEAYGALVGVTGQSIYKWEAGKSRPRNAQIEALAAIRSIGKRDAAARLASLQ